MDLKRQIVAELHKQARRNFPRRNTVVKGINDLYQADLVEVRPHSKMNKGYNYILTVINCFTKVADTIQLKDKSGKRVTSAMETIIRRDRNKMKYLQTDDGKEFFNKYFVDFMRNN
uniref:integrase catalytic domain-containing protein n=1 Tax=Klebsiella pneumoniae TaxID=573 RepID=UPI00117A6ABE